MSAERQSRRALDRTLGLIAAWLPEPDPKQILAAAAGWQARDWEAARKALFTQGVGPYFYLRLSQSAAYPALPPAWRGWLADEYARNAERLQRFHQELQAILRAARRAGIAVMPLKGSLLTTGYYPDPAVRPLADLDLLLHPEARAGMAALLAGLGYRFVSPENAYANHDRFTNPAADRVVFWDGEHPANPRPVEVHVRLARPLWGDVGALDLTGLLWDGSRPVDILGEPAWAPTSTALLTHLVLHTTQHLAARSGRLVMWLDLALLAPLAADLSRLPYPDQAYPALKLAARALPGRFQDLRFEALAVDLHPRLRRWCQRVPLDTRCGLADGTTPGARRRLLQRWDRWAPSPWRLALGYGRIPLPLAYMRHLGALMRQIHPFLAR